MRISARLAATPLLLALLLGVSGCVSNPSKSASDTDNKAATTEGKPAAQSGVPPGMNARGEVVDSSKVEGGHGQKVKGRGEWEGEITGKPAPGSKFTRLEIGMSMKEVTDLIGQPSDQGAYVTGKAWIPFYFGADRHRYEAVYKGQGRLVFAGGSVGDWNNGHLIWVIHNKNEGSAR